MIRLNIAVVVGVCALVGLTGCGGSSGDGGSGTGTQEFTLEPLEFPFANAAQASGIGAFGTPNWNGDKPHPGLDVSTFDNAGFDRVDVVSPTRGTVVSIQFIQTTTQHLISPHIAIQINPDWLVTITIEPGTDDPVIAEQQRQAVFVEVGDVVAPGDLLGQIVLDPSTETLGGIHLMLAKDSGRTAVCPYHHSSQTAQSIYDQLLGGESTQPPGGPVCFAEELTDF